MEVYVFEGGYAVMAHTETLARETVRQEWSKDHLGDPEEASKAPIILTYKANQLISFFC